MAALTSIRNKGKLIAICVGGALLAFVLGDLINSASSLFGASQAKMGEINGNTIDYNDFMAEVSSRENFVRLTSGRGSLDSETSEEIRDYCWDIAVRENAIGALAEKQGLAVTDQEIQTLVNTGNVTPSIRQAFVNPQTGMYDPSFVAEYVAAGSQQSRLIWPTLEKELRDTRQYVKYVGMISAGLYVTKAEVEQEFAHRTQMSDIKYVAVPYTDIKDEEVNVSQDDVMAVYNKNKNKYERLQESRDIAYVSFDVVPDEKDSADALKVAQDMKEDLAEVSQESVKDFVNSKSDVPYVDYYYGKGEIASDEVDSLMFAEQPGFIYGPYAEGDYYKVARLIEKSMRPDSVQVSHILVLCQSGADTLAARAKADSLFDVYKSGIDFGALAAEFSDDQGSSQDSGKLGWIEERTNYLPAEFKEACFATDKDKATIVKSSYGYHIIKVTDRTAPKNKVAVGFVAIEIRPSKQTRQAAYAKASMFAGNNRTPEEFEAAIEADKSLVRRLAPEVSANSRQISGIENSRELVRWAYNEDLCDQVSDVKEFGDRYIVACLAGVHPKGIAPVSEVKSEVAMEAYNNAKGDAIIAKMGQVSSIDAVAAQMGKPVQEASGVNFEMSQIPGMGFEPSVLAVAASLGQNQVSAPVKGKNGVYVVQATLVTPAQEIQPVNITTDQKMMMMELRNRTSYQAFQVLTKMANITDKRVKFF